MTDVDPHVPGPAMSQAQRVRTRIEIAAVGLLSVEGARIAAEARLDLFGVVVIGLITALGGGLIRDVLLGDVPPPGLRSWPLLAVSVAGAVVVIVGYPYVDHLPTWCYVTLDAAGVGLFCVAGAAKTLDLGLHFSLALVMGVLTGVGGGVVRDMMIDVVPLVLRAELYAVSLLVGAGVFVALTAWGRSRGLAMVAGGSVFCVLRLLSVWQDWNLPTVRGI
ncbi:trimeric intracellular cation channel family protein [Ilumatobacter sp.]|uniref:trimeric intracellular cation channel family protein n=1 Tax=Ilumatobacter sp. TaxID=1967498 RepID=UPI003C4471B9